MTTSSAGKKNILWLRGLLNGLFAWIIGFLLYMIPAFIIAVRMGFTLGPGSDDPAAVSAEISESISALYESSLSLSLAYILLLCVFIFLRARRINEKYGSKEVLNGLLVSVFPVFFSILFIVTDGFELLSAVEIVLFVVAGYLGGYVPNSSKKVYSRSGEHKKNYPE